MILKDFLQESKKRGVIHAQPVHGRHSDEPVSENGVILAQPVHGKHSRPLSGDSGHNKVDEGYNNKYSVSPEGHQHYIDFGDTNHNEHLGDSVNDVHRQINMSPEKYSQNPNTRMLHHYSVSSHVINRELINMAAGRPTRWDHTEFDDDKEKLYKDQKRKKFHEEIKKMDDALSHPNSKLKNDVHVFHGTYRFNPGEVAAKNGGKITLPAYTSTSIDAKQALDFADAGNSHNSHVIHIHLKKGQSGHYYGDHSAAPEEKEMLLPRNTTLRIHPKPTIIHSGGGAITHIWHAHIED